MRQAFFDVRGAEAFGEIKACAVDPDFATWLHKQTVKKPFGGAIGDLPESAQKFFGKIPLALCVHWARAGRSGPAWGVILIPSAGLGKPRKHGGGFRRCED